MDSLRTIRSFAAGLGRLRKKVEVVFYKNMTPKASANKIFLPISVCSDKEQMGKSVAYTIHEVGHTNFSNYSKEYASRLKARKYLQDLANILEDQFVEQSMIAENPGARYFLEPFMEEFLAEVFQKNSLHIQSGIPAAFLHCLIYSRCQLYPGLDVSAALPPKTRGIALQFYDGDVIDAVEAVIDAPGDSLTKGEAILDILNNAEEKKQSSDESGDSQDDSSESKKSDDEQQSSNGKSDDSQEDSDADTGQSDTSDSDEEETSDDEQDPPGESGDCQDDSDTDKGQPDESESDSDQNPEDEQASSGNSGNGQEDQDADTGQSDTSDSDEEETSDDEQDPPGESGDSQDDSEAGSGQSDTSDSGGDENPEDEKGQTTASDGIQDPSGLINIDFGSWLGEKLPVEDGDGYPMTLTLAKASNRRLQPNRHLQGIAEELTKAYVRRTGSVRKGKGQALRTNSLATVAAGTPIFGRRKETEGSAAEYIILLDQSSSMDCRWDRAVECTLTLADAMEKSGENRVQVFTYYRNYDYDVKTDQFTHKEVSINLVTDYRFYPELYPVGFTPTGEALEYAEKELEQSTFPRKGIIVITDGEADHGHRSISARIEGKGIELYAIGIDLYYTHFLEENFRNWVATSIDDLPVELSKVLSYAA